MGVDPSRRAFIALGASGIAATLTSFSWAQADGGSAAHAATSVVTISVDATAPGAPLERIWSYFGYDEVNHTTHVESRDLLRTLVDANTSPVFIRNHFLFNTGDGTPALKWGSTNIYSEDESGAPIYDYAIIDEVMDALVATGARPFAEIGFMPQALSSAPEPYRPYSPYVLEGGAFYPPRDYVRWGELVTAWTQHVAQRYPDAASSWQWELWNEPDIGYWQGSFDEFTRLYDTTEAALHAVLPDAQLGGPAVASAESTFLTRFLEHCATGTNKVSGKRGTRLDLITFHSKGGVSLSDGHVQMSLGNQLRLHGLGFDAIAASALAQTPIVISEADPEGCAACPVSTAPQNAYRMSPAYGAYVVAMMKRTLELARQREVQLRGVLTWAFTFPDTPYFAGYRALSTRGIHLPVLNAFKLLGRLGGQQLLTQTSGARPLARLLSESVRTFPEIDALATLDDARIRILVWNYHDDLVAAEPTPIELEVTLPTGFGARVLVTESRVDDEHGNAYAVWVSQGSPEAPSRAQLEQLRGAMQPLTSSNLGVAVSNGVAKLAFDLPRFGITLFTLEAARADPEADARNAASCACRMHQTRHTAPLATWVLALYLLRRRRVRHLP